MRQPELDVEIVRFATRGETIKIGAETVPLGVEKIVVEVDNVYGTASFLRGDGALEDVVLNAEPVEGGGLVIVTVVGNPYDALARLRRVLSPRVRRTAHVTILPGEEVGIGKVIIDIDKGLGNDFKLPPAPRGVKRTEFNSVFSNQITVEPDSHCRHDEDRLCHILGIWLAQVGIRLT